MSSARNARRSDTGATSCNRHAHDRQARMRTIVLTRCHFVVLSVPSSTCLSVRPSACFARIHSTLGSALRAAGPLFGTIPKGSAISTRLSSMCFAGSRTRGPETGQTANVHPSFLFLCFVVASRFPLVCVLQNCTPPYHHTALNRYHHARPLPTIVPEEMVVPPLFFHRPTRVDF